MFATLLRSRDLCCTLLSVPAIPVACSGLLLTDGHLRWTGTGSYTTILHKGHAQGLETTVLKSCGARKCLLRSLSAALRSEVVFPAVLQVGLDQTHPLKSG